MLHSAAHLETIEQVLTMCLAAMLPEGQALSAFIGVCLLILAAATFVWSQWAWEKHTKAGRVLLFLASAFLFMAGLMFLGLVNLLERS